MGMIIFVVLQRTFNTDSDYSELENGAGNAKIAFRSEHSAECEQRRLTRAAYLRANPDSFSEEAYANCSIEDINDILGDSGVDSRGDIHDIWDDLDGDTKVALWELVDFGSSFFYTVQRIEVSDCRVREPVPT